MPNRAKRSCPRCGTLVLGRRCQVCQARRFAAMSARRPPSEGSNPYKDPAWVACSREYRKANPYCECEVHRAIPWAAPLGQLVDHIDGLGPRGPRGLDWTNLMTMTRSCHAAKTNRHDGGLGNLIQRVTS